MNREGAGSDSAPFAAIDLARESAFSLAHLTITPAALTVAAPGWSQRLEPRAMQMLVALAQATPAVIGRDELNRRVWGGRVVGNDAINRAVQTLRRVAAEAPAPLPFTIHTVPRVGYCLAASEGIAHGRPDPVPAPAPVLAILLGSRRLVQVLATVALLAATFFGWRTLAPGVATAEWRIVDAATLDDLPAGASDVALSSDGRLAYRAADAQGRDRIFVRASGNGGAGSAVSPVGVDARHPVWSPDGRALAFVVYDTGRPCRLLVVRPGSPATPVGGCESARDPRLAWGSDGRTLMFGDANGINAVQRIGAIAIADGHRTVLSSPPGDSLGDTRPIAREGDIVFQREFGWADAAWIARDTASGREHQLWRRQGVADSVAAPLPNGTLAVAWTRAGTSRLDLVAANGSVRSQPLAIGPVTAIAAVGDRLLVETDGSESELVRPGEAAPLAVVRGRIAGPALLPDGRLLLPVSAAGVARIWERDAAGSLRHWGSFSAARIVGITPSPDSQLTTAIASVGAGGEVVLFDGVGKLIWRWNPHARSVNPAAWRPDGRRLIVPVLDGVGWRLFEINPFGRGPARDLGLPGFAVLLADGDALYAVRAGETTGLRELWRLDGGARRLPIDLTLFDIVNWRPVAAGVWMPDRSDRERPRLELREADTGRVLRRVDAPSLAGAASGLAADTRGPVYVRTARDPPEYTVLTLQR